MRPQHRHQRRDRRVIRNGDDTVVLGDAVGVDLGITSGIFGSIRKADELSITTAPAFTATGENFLEIPLPAENRAISTPSNEFSVSSSMTTFRPRKSIVLPAERALASALSLPTRNARLSMVAMNSAPTAPVAPAMAITGSFFSLASIRQ
jgi:hypothetical protein